MQKTFSSFLCAAAFFLLSCSARAQNGNDLAVIAYYSGGLAQVDSFSAEKLTHIIFSFCHLKGNRLHVENARDTAIIQRLVGLKERNPRLKVILSLGGWGGCETCSDVFSTGRNRVAFALSVLDLSRYFGTDGIDLDWEYPAIEGYPNHKYKPADKPNFTSLVMQLRKVLGSKYEISFAAGGYDEYIDKAVEWERVMKVVNYVNLMTYDLVNGYATITGHHTPLYTTSRQKQSVDNAVTRLLNMGIPARKLVIGAAFYGRVWENVAATDNGLYQSGHFKEGVAFKNFNTHLSADSGFVYHWDSGAHAPYLYNERQKLFVTYDDTRSMELKTAYALQKGLGGIMFWELASDTYTNGLLDVIDKTRLNYLKR